MPQQCSNCRHYNPLKSGEPPAGWCEFTLETDLPFWMAARRLEVDRLGADVVATDGAQCNTFVEKE